MSIPLIPVCDFTSIGIRTYIHGCGSNIVVPANQNHDVRDLSAPISDVCMSGMDTMSHSSKFSTVSPSTPPGLPSVGCTTTGCQHLSVAPFSVRHFTRVHVCNKFPVLKKWKGQYVWLEILSLKFHRYDVVIFQALFSLVFHLKSWAQVLRAKIYNSPT